MEIIGQEFKFKAQARTKRPNTKVVLNAILLITNTVTKYTWDLKLAYL